MSREYHASCVGATVYAEKTIYVSEAGSTLHEFGHYLYHILGYPSQVEQLYRDEAKSASIFLRDYAMTNCREYFADYFAYYVMSNVLIMLKRWSRWCGAHRGHLSFSDVTAKFCL